MRLNRFVGALFLRGSGSTGSGLKVFGFKVLGFGIQAVPRLKGSELQFSLVSYGFCRVGFAKEGPGIPSRRRAEVSGEALQRCRGKQVVRPRQLGGHWMKRARRRHLEIDDLPVALEHIDREVIANAGDSSKHGSRLERSSLASGSGSMVEN